MKISWTKAAWLVISLTVSGCLAYVAFHDPLKFVPFTDLLATIISILIGLFLAISAILSTRPRVAPAVYGCDEDRTRLEALLKSDYRKLQEGQFFLFWFYYASLILAVALKFMGIQWEETGSESVLLRIISSGFVFASSLSLLWSATLPSLMRGINAQRMALE